MIIDMLAAYKLWVKKTKLQHGIAHSDDQFIFYSSWGSPIAVSTLREALREMFEKKELDIPTITPHGLRHTHATLLLVQGVTAHNVAKRLGNTADMIYKVYGHAVKELENESVELFSQAVNL
ncbi:tyrosine-type recombinase/integrase [Edaphobacillus lindanitolerans]|uniref:tyrosine-type recombinase/integrase n=1 Tax=Edaphobacillus lindanitolerans TaxID=550447 RepID=UPI0013566A75|nr:tyrosine-type recombinase/integrase [Edaphobacillus lindanitolerans]